jgi:hypothetical protein
VIRLVLVVEMPAGDQRRMAITLGPFDAFLLGAEGAQDMVSMIFNDIVTDRGSCRSPLGAGFYIHVAHSFSFPFSMVNCFTLRPPPRRAPVTGLELAVLVRHD